MRREVFFAGAEAVSKADTYIRQFGNFSLTDTQHRELINDYAAKTAKIHVVGRLSTVEKLTAFNEKFVEITVQLGRDRAAMMDLKAALDATTRNWADLSAKQLEQYLGLSNLKIAPEELAKAAGGLLRQRQEMAEGLGHRSLELFQRSFDLADELVPLETDAVIAAREDLGFGIEKPVFDPVKYRAVITEAATRQKKAWRIYIDSLKPKKEL